MTTSDLAAAPWQLTGHGYAFAIRCAAEFGQRCLDSAPGFRGRALGGVGAVIIADYATSDVGPYRELLVCPGLILFGKRRVRAITHIWVSTQASVVNGRKNWGLPKELAHFAVRNNDDGSETFTVQQHDKPALTLTLSPHGPTLPVNTRMLPRSWRTLAQPWEGQRFKTTIKARGRGRYCALAGYDNPDASGFPDFADQKRLVGVAASEFALTFPVSETTPL